MKGSTMDTERTPLYKPSEKEKARDYKPKYHVFYDPNWGAPRAESLPVGVIEDKAVEREDTTCE